LTFQLDFCAKESNGQIVYEAVKFSIVKPAEKTPGMKLNVDSLKILEI